MKKTISIKIFAICIAMATAAVILYSATNSFSTPAPVELKGATMRLSVETEPFSIKVKDLSGREMLSSTGPVSYTKVTHQKIWRLVLWWFWTRGFKRPWQKADTVVALDRDGDTVLIDLAKKTGGPAVVRIRARFMNDRALRIETEVIDDDGINRIRMKFDRDEDDLYYGMGERYDSVEHGGKNVRNWAEEGGLGLFTLSKYVDLPFNSFPKGPDTTYFPVPFFMNSAKGYGLLLDDNRYSEFDFGKARKKELRIENYNSRLDLIVFYGPSPLEIIETQTAYTGRIKVPAPWNFAPMAAVVENEERVLEIAELLRNEKIPTSAIWSESWWWRTEWEVNRELYPNYEKMIEKLHENGFRHLAYYQPYISLETEAYKEGDANGYFIKNKEGATYDFLLGYWKKAQLDPTNPDAVKWWTESFFANSERMGADGWMHDYGEHVPPDSVAFDGRTGWELHNEYTLLWLKMGRDFWEKARPDGDYCIYIRGGYTGAQKYVPIMWTGDPNSNFDPIDGLPATIPAIMSVGISGHPIGSTDIAGYNCFVNDDADKELFMRWTEMGALFPVMRNHRGMDEKCNHWEFCRDRETLEHYKKYAILHTALFPYFNTLAHIAAQKGWPVTRHMSLHYPNDPETRQMDYQFMVGDRVMVAPVIERDAREWEVYLPEGEWFHWWSGVAYTGPGKHVVPAPLGELPMFVSSGKILPIFNSQIDTLVKENREDINGWDDADSSMAVVFFGEGKDAYTLWDGTGITCERKPGENGTCAVTGDPVGRRWEFNFR